MIGKTIRLDKAWEKWTSKAHGHALTRVTLVSVTPVSLQHHHLYHLYILAELPKNLKEFAQIRNGSPWRIELLSDQTNKQNKKDKMIGNLPGPAPAWKCPFTTNLGYLVFSRWYSQRKVLYLMNLDLSHHPSNPV